MLRAVHFANECHAVAVDYSDRRQLRSATTSKRMLVPYV